eukprot:3379019-Pleurochrysis_carterae.AAC.5
MAAILLKCIANHSARSNVTYSPSAVNPGRPLFKSFSCALCVCLVTTALISLCELGVKPPQART